MARDGTPESHGTSRPTRLSAAPAGPGRRGIRRPRRHESPARDGRHDTNDRPRVAVVYHFFAHYRGAVIQELLESEEFEFLFVGDTVDPADSGIVAHEFEADAPFLRVHSTPILGGLLVQSGLVSLALRSDVDCVIYLADAHYVTTWISAGIARLRGKRVLFWTHGWTAPDRGAKGLVRKAFYREAHALLLYGDRARDIATSRGFDPSSVYVIYNSLDYELQRRLRQTVDSNAISAVRNLFARPADPIVLFSGRLIRSARVDMIIDAVASLSTSVNLLVVGAGPELESLRHAAEGRRVPAVFMGSEYDEARLAAYFLAANVTVSPGKIGLLTIHSLAYGTPVVTHDRPDLQGPESEAVVPGITGSVFSYGSVESLADAIGEWTRRTREIGEVDPNCVQVVESRYVAHRQRAIIERAIRGVPAVPDAGPGGITV